MKRNKGDRRLFIAVNILLIIILAVHIFDIFTDTRLLDPSANGGNSQQIQLPSFSPAVNTKTPSPTSSPSSVNTGTPSPTPNNTPSPSPSNTPIPYDYLFIDENLLYNDSIKTIFDAAVNLQDNVEVEYTDSNSYDDMIDDFFDLYNSTQYVNLLSGVSATVNGNKVIIEFEYDDRMKIDFVESEKEAERLANQIFTNTMTDIDKAKAAHDYLILNTVYDEKAANSWSVNSANSKYNRAFTSYGALIEGYAVCQGYAIAYNMLLNNVGIETRLISSDTLNHAWSMVEIEGDWYHCDVTFDDPTPDTLNSITYAHFMKNDDYMSSINKDRLINTSPKANSENYYYDIYNYEKLKMNSIFYAYHLENDELVRYEIVNDEILLSTKSNIVSDVSSWEFVSSQMDIIYTQKSDGDVYMVDTNGYYKTKLKDVDDTYIIAAEDKYSKYILSCVKGINGTPFDLEIDK